LVDLLDDDPGRFQPRVLRQVRMGVVDAETATAGSIAHADPGADAFRPKERAPGWNVGRFFEPERAAVEFVELPAIEEYRAILARRATVIAPDANVAVAAEEIRQSCDLFIQGLLYAEDVGCGRAQDGLQSALSDWPSELVPGHPGFGAMKDVPCNDTNY